VGGGPAVNIGRAPTLCRQLNIDTSYAVFRRTVFYVSRNVDYSKTASLYYDAWSEKHQIKQVHLYTVNKMNIKL
jgi:hypothetical protein